MPKANMNPDDAVVSQSTGFGVQAGRYRVIDAAVIVHLPDEFEGMAEKPVKGTKLELTLVHQDSDGNAVDEDTTETLLLPIQSRGTDKFRPGKGKSPDDDDPADVGHDVGGRGNTIYSETGAAPGAGTSISVFNKSLIKAGAKPEIITRAWCPDYVGLEFELKTCAADKLEQYGSKNSDMKVQSGKKKGEPVYFKVVDKVYVWPKGAGKNGTAKAASGATNKKKADESAEDVVSPVIEAIAAKMAGKTIKRAQFGGYFTATASQAKMNKTVMEETKKKFADNDELEVILGAVGAVLDAESGEITFG